jgi:hypothetical protein
MRYLEHIRWLKDGLGRPRVDHLTEQKVRRLLDEGMGIKRTARTVGVGVATVQRIKAGS